MVSLIPLFALLVVSTSVRANTLLPSVIELLPHKQSAQHMTEWATCTSSFIRMPVAETGKQNYTQLTVAITSNHCIDLEEYSEKIYEEQSVSAVSPKPTSSHGSLGLNSSELLLSSPVHDVAILNISSNKSVLNLRSANLDLRKGDQLYISGFGRAFGPHQMTCRFDTEMSMFFTAEKSFDYRLRVLCDPNTDVINANDQSGFSGAPVVDEDGNVVGIFGNGELSEVYIEGHKKFVEYVFPLYRYVLSKSQNTLNLTMPSPRWVRNSYDSWPDPFHQYHFEFEICTGSRGTPQDMVFVQYRPMLPRSSPTFGVFDFKDQAAISASEDFAKSEYLQTMPEETYSRALEAAKKTCGL